MLSYETQKPIDFCGNPLHGFGEIFDFLCNNHRWDLLVYGEYLKFTSANFYQILICFYIIWDPEAYWIWCQSIERFWGKNFFTKKSQILRIVDFRTITLVLLNQFLPNFDMFYTTSIWDSEAYWFWCQSIERFWAKTWFFTKKNPTDFENCWFSDNNCSLPSSISTKFWYVVKIYASQKPIDFYGASLHDFGEKLDFLLRNHKFLEL